MPEIIGHRGAPRAHLENTLPAFAHALAEGADGVELDVHLTRDGRVVVHHDAVLRAAPDAAAHERAIATCTAAEVRAVRLDGGAHVPTLDEVLDLLGTRATAYVELKGRGVGDAVLDVLDRHRTPAAVHSFDHRAVRRAVAARPAVRAGVLLSSYVVDPLAVLAAAGAADLWQEWEWIDAGLVETVHSAGGRVIAWTANAPEAVQALAALGVDAICTDLPAAARAALSAGRADAR